MMILVQKPQAVGRMRAGALSGLTGTAAAQDSEGQPGNRPAVTTRDQNWGRPENLG